MRSTFLILLSCILSLSATAQRFSTGVRTGASHWISINYHGSEVAARKTFTWDKELYLRYENKKRLAIEFSGMHYNMSYDKWQDGMWYCGNVPYETLSSNTSYNAYEYTLSFQRDVSCKKIKNLKSYIGLSMSYRLEHQHTKTATRDLTTNEVSNASYKYVDPLTLYGVNHYTSYNLTKHLSINSQLSFKCDPFSVFNERHTPGAFWPNSKFSWTFGAGYRF